MKELERSSIAGMRKALSALGVVVAEVDRQLRYVWIDNPHPDFEPKAAVGKRDDELASRADAAEIMALKQEAFTGQVPISRTLSFKRTDGLRYYSLFVYPIREPTGTVDAILTVGFDAGRIQPVASNREAA